MDKLNKTRQRTLLALRAMTILVSMAGWSGALAQAVVTPQDIKGPADIGRIKPEEKLPASTHQNDFGIAIPSGVTAMRAPKDADKIKFTLKAVHIVGATAFSPEELANIYTPDLNHTITLARVYAIAASITQRYRDAGYFLSIAYVPQQEVGKGSITIQVVEGYVGAVIVPPAMQEHAVIEDYIESLKAQKPLRADMLESTLLRLNDLPGFSVSGTLSGLDGAKDGAVQLTLVAADKEGKGQINFDNYSSRFLGPNEASVTYSKSLLPLQQTTVSGLTSMPTDKLKYGTLEHAAVLAPDTLLDLTGGITKAQPGYTLKSFEIDSESTFLGASVNYQWIRQRQENLSFRLGVDGRNTTSDLLGTAFTRERVRALRLSANYDTYDRWSGYDMVTAKISQGVPSLGASKKGDLNLSRAEATPDFTKAELSASHLQAINDDWSMLLASSAQVASGPLYSSEEFGYGGQGFGRAFDASELTGDHGINGSVEVSYRGWGDMEPVNFSPYAFYDIGVVWNDDTAQVKRESGAAVGFGVRSAVPEIGVNSNLGLAWPLMRDVATPIYGQSPGGPRILLQFAKDF